MLFNLLAALFAGGGDAPPEPQREFRAVWVATVANIDWPSKRGLSVDVQKKELIRILDQCKNVGLNAVIIQVRPMCDALYESIVLAEDSRAPATDRTDLVMTLADVYEYKLDFTREIQPGDQYRFVYEREARPDGTARARRIIAAEIVSKDRPYTAVLFNVEGGV